jgi:hypothetical protein
VYCLDQSLRSLIGYRFDTGVYDEALDDFGTNQEDFM